MNKLAVYDETVEVVKILKELLADIVTRREVCVSEREREREREGGRERVCVRESL